MRALKLTVMAALLVLGTTAARADQTNLVENIQVRLFGLRQGGTSSNRNTVVTSVDVVSVETRQVIQALGTATGHNFGGNSRLVLITPLNGNPAAVEVRDRGNKVNVTGFFVLEQTGPGVHSSVRNVRSGLSTRTIYSIQRFVLQDSPDFAALATHFDVNGLAVDFSAGRPVPGPDNSLTMEVSGNGDRNGAALVIQGSIRISGQTLETVDDVNPTGGNPT